MEQLEIYLDAIRAKLPALLVGLSVLLVLIICSRILKKLISARVKPKAKNPLIADFIGQVVSTTIVLIGVILFFQIIGFGSVATTLVTGAGIMTFIIGFTFKDIGENFLSGILMAFKSPFRIGDLVQTGDITGYVTSLSLRETTLKSLDGKDVFIPNSTILKEPLSNFTIDGFLRYEFVIGVDYQEGVAKILEDIQNRMETIPGVLLGAHKPSTFISGFETNTVNIKVLFWIDTFDKNAKADHFQIKSRAMNQVLNLLLDSDINMPANIMELKNYQDKKFEIDVSKQ